MESHPPFVVAVVRCFLLPFVVCGFVRSFPLLRWMMLGAEAAHSAMI
jgi:hypothetical protein